MKRWITLMALCIAVLLMIPTLSMADIYMKQKQHTDATQMMGTTQPARDVVMGIWITPKGFRTDDPERSTIMLADEKKVIVIDHKTKTYMEQPLNMDDMMAGMSQGKTPEENAAMKQMMQKMMKMDAAVSETNDHKIINHWECKKYIATIHTAMGQITNEIWATQDLNVDKKIYDQMASRMMSAMPGLQTSMESMKKEMDKIKGVQVLTVSTYTMMNQPHKTTTELLEFKEGTAPKNIFAIPTGYTKQTNQ